LEENAHSSHACSNCDDEAGERRKGERQAESNKNEKASSQGREEISGREGARKVREKGVRGSEREWEGKEIVNNN